jgi:hypothetical protein
MQKDACNVDRLGDDKQELWLEASLAQIRNTSRI